MLDIVRFVGEMFSSLYKALDVQIFPDINLSLIEIIIGIVLFGVFIKFLFSLGSNFNLSISSSMKGIRFNRKNDDYTPKHGKR